MLALAGWLVVIVLIFFIVVYMLSEMVGRALDFAEANPMTVAVYALIILVILLANLKPGPGLSSADQPHAKPSVACSPALVACPPS